MESEAIGKEVVSAPLNEKGQRPRGNCCLHLYLERWEEESIQNPNGGIEEGRKPESGDGCGESE